MFGLGRPTGIDLNQLLRDAGPKNVWPWPVEARDCPATRERLRALEREHAALRQYVESLETKLAEMYARENQPCGS